MQASKIVTDETYKEVQAHRTPDYPISFYYEDIFLFDFRCIEWHWHPELELIYAEDGCFEAQVGNELVTMKTGEALLINQNVIIGFQNVGYFCRKFKEVYSVTPGEYCAKR